VKVLHVTHSIANSYGGPTQSLKGYAEAARRFGAEVTVAAPACDPADSSGLESVVDSIHQFPTAFGKNAFTVAPGLIKWLRQNATRYDIIHVHGLFNPISSLGARACIHSKVPTVIRPFGTLSRYTFNHRRRALKRVWFTLVESHNIQRAAGIHFTTDAERDEAKWRVSDVVNRSYIVPPPFSRDSNEENVTNGRREKIVLFLSRLHPVKNLEALIEAWSSVTARRNGWKLVIAGSGSPGYEKSIRALSETVVPRQSVELTGFLRGDAKKEILARSSLFVLPSRHENFGVAVLEAISAGVPCVVTPEVQLAPFLAANGLGLVSSAEPRTLADNIVRALDDQDLATRAAQIGPGLVENYFGLVSIGQRLMHMYASAIDQRPAHRTRPSIN